jgi:hypothetical protein
LSSEGTNGAAAADVVIRTFSTANITAAMKNALGGRVSGRAGAALSDEDLSLLFRATVARPDYGVCCSGGPTNGNLVI